MTQTSIKIFHQMTICKWPSSTACFFVNSSRCSMKMKTSRTRSKMDQMREVLPVTLILRCTKIKVLASYHQCHISEFRIRDLVIWCPLLLLISLEIGNLAPRTPDKRLHLSRSFRWLKENHSLMKMWTSQMKKLIKISRQSCHWGRMANFFRLRLLLI